MNRITTDTIARKRNEYPEEDLELAVALGLWILAVPDSTVVEITNGVLRYGMELAPAERMRAVCRVLREHVKR